MTEREVVTLAVACLIGAVAADRLAVLPGTAVLAVAVGAALLRQPKLLIAAALILCAVRSEAAWRALDAPMPDRIVATATLRTDPVRSNGSTTALLRIDGRNVLATAWGPVGARLAMANAGDHADVVGATRRWSAPRQRRATLHTSHRLSVESLTIKPATGVLWRIANALRARISGGAEGLDPERRALFTGLVFGDDRGQSPVTEADFRLAGLTHLLAVSGQNVAYVLILCRPLHRRLPFHARWVATLTALMIFATATRFEPSVLRATAMAAIAATADMLGRGTSSRRILALAVSALVIHDPLLAWSVGFQLSVAATTGIVVWREPIARRLGDGAVAGAISVTLAAQLGVAPLLIHQFGPVSMVSIPANLLAAPVAGLVMAWGMTAGLVAGMVGSPVSTVVQSVTSLALWWLETVARLAASVPLAPVGLVWLAAAVAVVSGLVVAGSARPVRLGAVVIALVLLVQLRPSTPRGVHLVGPASSLRVGPATTVLVLQGRSDPVWMLEDLRDLGVGSIDIAVIEDGRDRDDLDAVASRIEVTRVVAVDTSTPDSSTTYRAGDVELLIAIDDAGLDVTVRHEAGID